MTKPEDKALAFAHSFLGIRLQCAQCHKHPFAPWTQADFQQFSAFFKNVEFGVSPDAANEYRQLAGKVGLSGTGNQGSAIRPDVLRHAQDGGVIPWRELYIAKGSGPASLSLLRSGIVAGRRPSCRDHELDETTEQLAAEMDWARQREIWEEIAVFYCQLT